MSMARCLEAGMIEEFEHYLYKEEKSAITVEKYLRDIRAFFLYTGKRKVEKELVIQYKENLIDSNYAVNSINSMLSSVNAFLKYLGWSECQVKGIKTQKQIYCTEETELTKEEYKRLLCAANDNPRLKLIIQTICSTGIRVSELEYFTVDAVKQGEVNVSCKSKIRIVLLPGALRKLLLQYAKRKGIKSGIIFRTKTGKPINRSNIWAEMKRLSEKAKVSAKKIFPHNLRKLFARTFYKFEKDIAKLADILGHSNINTTRIYIISTGTEHRKKIERLGLLE